MRCMTAATIGQLIKAHVDGDEKKFRDWAEFIAGAYEDSGDELGARIIRNRLNGVESSAMATLDKTV